MTSAFVTPGSTVMRRLATSTPRIRRIFASTTSTPSATGSAPPDNPVPAPRATYGTPAATHARTTPATSSAVRGSTATPGTTRCPVNPSHA